MPVEIRRPVPMPHFRGRWVSTGRSTAKQVALCLFREVTQSYLVSMARVGLLATARFHAVDVVSSEKGDSDDRIVLLSEAAVAE